MATFDAHVTIVRQNFSLLHNILIPSVDHHPDWVVTVTFYTALHMVEAMFFEDLPTQHTHKHDARHKVLQGPRYSSLLWHDYRVLYSKSRLARYLQTPTNHYTASFAAHCPPRTVVSTYVTGHLGKVRDETEQLIRQHRPGFAFFSPPPPVAAGS